MHLKPVFFILILCMSLSFLLSFDDLWAKEIFPGVHKIVFPNGLSAIVKVNHRAPVVAVQIWVKAGSSYETDREAGITHLIEHMIFKGTYKRGPGAIAREIESVGGKINAYTSHDYTVYHCEVPKIFLELALDVLSDAVFNSKFDPKELEKEKKVVLEEINMREDSPSTRLSRILMETSYTSYPYKRPVIGFPKTVMSFTRDDILSYMSKRYIPQNISVVVTGDLKAETAMESIFKTFSEIKRKEADKITFPTEPSQEEPRISLEPMEINVGHLAISFSGLPNFNSDITPTLDVLAEVLGGGESSRLNLTLKNNLQIVHSIHAGAYTPRGPGIFEIAATLEPEKTREAISQIIKEIYRLKTYPISIKELERAKIAVESDFVYSQETMSGEAQKLGLFETLSKDPEAELFYLRNVRSVTLEDIQKVVQEFFHGNNLNVVMVMPKEKKPEITVQNLIDMTLSADAQFKPVEVKKAEEKRKIQKVRFKNALTVLVHEAEEVPTVSLEIVFPGGVRYENADTNGVFPFLSRAWTKGTKKMNAQEFAETVEDIGGSIDGFSGQNTFGLQARFLRKNFDKGLQLFLDCLLEPAFSPEETEKLKPILLAKLKSQDDNLPALAFREFRRLLFSPHPYGMNPLGSEKVINNVTSAQLKDFWARYARPDTAVLSVVGDVNADSIIQKLQTILESWHNFTDLSIPVISPPAILKSPELFAISKDKQQVHLVLGFRGAPLNSEERYPVEVLNAILSGQGGRLFSILRDRDSLAYSVTSINSLGLDYGAFAFYLACSPDKKEEAIKSLWREIYRIMDTPVSTEEIDRAKKWIIGTHEIDLQTNEASALDMALNELYGLGYDFSLHYGAKIEKVTKEDIRKAAKKIFTPDKYVLIQVGS